MEREAIEAALLMAERHVSRGEQHIARQIEIIAELERDGHPTRVSRELLRVFEETQRLHVADRDRLWTELHAAR